MIEPPKLSEDEERILNALAHRQREQEEAETALLKKYASRAAIAKQVWGIGFAVVVAIVLGTAYVLGLQRNVERAASDVSELRLVTQKLSETIQQMRLDLKDKADRPRP